jgi:hypothetical protein
VFKLGNMFDKDHATHFLGWIERPIPQSLVWTCSYIKDTMEGEPMMWASSEMDGNKHEKKWLVVERNALKWIKANNALPK